MVSMITAPESSAPSWMPASVTIGSEALRSVCRIIRPADTPLARSNSVWSLRSTSTTAERVSRVSDASAYAPSEIAGSTSGFHPPCPNGGNQPSFTEKIITSRMREPERRDRLAGEGEALAELVDEPPRPCARQHAERDAEHRGERERAQPELDRVRERVEDQAAHVAPVGERVAEVAVGEILHVAARTG